MEPTVLGAPEKTRNIVLAVPYACRHNTYLYMERASKFSEKVASSSSYVPPERLPQTTDAATFYSRMVYHQVQAWLDNIMLATEWGWVIHKIRLVTVLKPQQMEQVAPPASLLKIVRCNCTGNCGNNMLLQEKWAPIYTCLWPMQMHNMYTWAVS